MADYMISYANLNGIERALSELGGSLGEANRKIEALDAEVGRVESNVRIVLNDVQRLADEFREFVANEEKVHHKQDSQTRLIQIRQELEKRFGHHDIVRRTTTGILQADDLAIVKKSTITNATEEIMISTPGYWLAPCLVALAAWINDQPELAEKAVKEGLRRDDAKSSLFWALVCRRADRKSASLKWMQRYLENQDEENLDRKTVIILDAYASGLFGADTEGVISKQMTEWLDNLVQQENFVPQQKKQWSDAIYLKRKPMDGRSYPNLQKFSRTWPRLKDVMEGAMLHAEILGYFTSVFGKESSTRALKEQLDDILTSLVTDFDEEETPLRKEEKYHMLVVEFEGDKDEAKKRMAIEQSAFEEHKNFAQLLTDAAMKPESSHASVSTQKFAIALSKEWISDAYNDVVAENRSKFPRSIEINVDTFNDATVDGSDEEAIVARFNNQVDQEKANALSKVTVSAFEQFCLYGGIAVGALGLVLTFVKMKTFVMFFGIIAVIAGIGMVIKHFSSKSKVAAARKNIEGQFEQKRSDGVRIIRATVAEIVDFRAEFFERDAESQKVVDFLDQISPDQYVRKLSGTGRRIKVSV